MTVLKLGRKSSKKCPECGGETVIEETEVMGKKELVRRCDNLIEVSFIDDLQPCTWSEEIYRNGRPKPTSNN